MVQRHLYLIYGNYISRAIWSAAFSSDLDQPPTIAPQDKLNLR